MVYAEGSISNSPSARKCLVVDCTVNHTTVSTWLAETCWNSLCVYN